MEMVLPAQPEHLLRKGVKQIIAFLGDGSLADDTTTSREYRHLLSLAPLSVLRRFAAECLSSSFPDSGRALQDVVNELGRRLGFQVEFGRYSGKTGKTAPDGIWEAGGHHLVVESKTTDTYRFPLERLVAYQAAVTEQRHIDSDASSILIIVGREDTGGLEEQIRGSKYAWAIRLLGVDALLSLVELTTEVNDEATVRKVCEVLRPREYTRVDGIIDLVFNTARDASRGSSEEQDEVEPEVIPGSDDTNRRMDVVDPGGAKEKAMLLAATSAKVAFMQASRTIAKGPSGEVLLVVYSKFHVTHQYYWFGYHDRQDALLKAASMALVALVCSNAGVVLLPREVIVQHLPELYVTEKAGRKHWHVVVRQKDGVPTHVSGLGAESLFDVGKYFHPFAKLL